MLNIQNYLQIIKINTIFVGVHENVNINNFYNHE